MEPTEEGRRIGVRQDRGRAGERDVGPGRPNFRGPQEAEEFKPVLTAAQRQTRTRHKHYPAGKAPARPQ